MDGWGSGMKSRRSEKRRRCRQVRSGQRGTLGCVNAQIIGGLVSSFSGDRSLVMEGEEEEPHRRTILSLSNST